MWRSFLAPLARPKNLSSIWGDGKCALRRHLTQPTKVDSLGRRAWTAEEVRKVEGLIKQGLQPSRMADEMEGRSFLSVRSKICSIKKRLQLPSGDYYRSNVQPWSVEELALLLEKHQQGLGPRHMMRYFPGRSQRSIEIRLLRLKSRPVAQQQESDGFADGKIQRMIDMRLKEAKTHEEIASELKSSKAHIRHLWNTRCIQTLSEEEMSLIRMQKRWTPNETKHLFELYRRGMECIHDVALQFPSKTVAAVRVKRVREGLAKKRVQRGTANWKAAAKRLAPQEGGTKELDTADMKAQV